MNPLYMRLRHKPKTMLDSIKEMSRSALERRTARPTLIFALLIATLLPIGIMIAVLYLDSVMIELEYYGYAMYTITQSVVFITPVVIHMLMLGVFRISADIYAGKEPSISELLFAFRQKRFLKSLICSVASTAMLAFCALMVSLVIDAFVTLHKLTELYALSYSAGFVLISCMVSLALIYIILKLLSRLCFVPFLLVIHPEERITSLVRTSCMLAEGKSTQIAALLFNIFVRAILSLALLLVPWLVIFAPNDLMLLSGFTLATLEKQLLPDDLQIHQDIAQSADVAA